VHARLLDEQFEVHSLLWLHTDHELVADKISKNIARDILKLDADLKLRMIKKSRHTSALRWSRAFPQRRMNGTPSHLSLQMLKIAVANVAVFDPLDVKNRNTRSEQTLGTVGSS
jgi:hypothetical protein